ncbi:Scd6-like Sm domain-containing protein [Mucor mucedo]|uniref:Scd6-like Sm domain-containing protein n=1 Tax=Mucor mucedo TaxID=29922 RepID=UPI00221E926F|nr:Scd6-like Sm domain-containing protein [Mucor mucedo]KAI7891578.1 Scd6-like Sm domain-containing protein [Mucor mucedo]
MAGENYIGSKISLISLSDIRYVGILHSINAQDSTVGLKQVRSFGTEGRRGKPEEEIPSSDNVFDYVVFRGSDIKDLQVFEAPPKPTPPPQQAIPQDPAIMSMSGYPPMNPYMNNGYMQPQQQQHQSQPQQQQQQQQQAPSSGNQKYWPAYNDQELEKAKLEKDTMDGLKAELEETDALQPTINEAAIEQLAKKVSELNASDDNVISNKPLDDQHQQQSRRRYDNNNNNNYNNNYRGRGGRYNNERSFNNKPKAEFTIPTSEFDFEASNAKFDKSEIVKKETEEVDFEEEELEIPSPDEFYDKTSSFFDNISCESKERNEQRQLNEPRRSHFHEERKLNLETFGQATVDQSRYRNNYRGRGNYRGGNRGGNNNQGYYRNNNRNNNYNNNNGYRQNKPQDQQESI